VANYKTLAWWSPARMDDRVHAAGLVVLLIIVLWITKKPAPTDDSEDDEDGMVASDPAAVKPAARFQGKQAGRAPTGPTRPPPQQEESGCEDGVCPWSMFPLETSHTEGRGGYPAPQDRSRQEERIASGIVPPPEETTGHPALERLSFQEGPGWGSAEEEMWSGYLLGESGARNKPNIGDPRNDTGLLMASGGYHDTPPGNHMMPTEPHAGGGDGGATFHMVRGRRHPGGRHPPSSRVNQSDMGVVSGFSSF
jgi:hypothetical protein